MTGKVKVKGDLLLAQRLEEAVEKMGAREVSRNGARSIHNVELTRLYSVACDRFHQGKSSHGELCHQGQALIA